MSKWQPWQIGRRFQHAARLITERPERFDATTIYVPQTLDDKGDALGWIGFGFAVKGEGVTTQNVLEHVGLPDTQTFYDQMAAIDPSWKDSAPQCAAALLKYVDVHHLQ